MKLEEIMKEAVGKEVEIEFLHELGTDYELGTLIEVNQDVITIKDAHGLKHINRKACQIVSFMTIGE